VNLQLAHRLSGKPMPDLYKEIAKGRTPEQVIARAQTAKAEPSPSPSAPAKSAAHETKGRKAGAHAR
jgi:hypothetical protein